MNWFSGSKTRRAPKLRSEFNDAPKWTLVNDFTIHEEEKLSSGSSFARNCVPKRLHLTLTNLQVVQEFNWKGELRSDSQLRGYEPRPRIQFDATLDGDRITVFTMDKGAIATFEEIKNANIYPFHADEIGGSQNASSYDGIRNTTSELIPAGGLMSGEPSKLVFWEEENSLLLTLCIGEPTFEKLANNFSRSGGQVESITLAVLCELFEGEVSAALGADGMREYGLLLKPKGHQFARARVDTITMFDRKLELVGWDALHQKEPTLLEANIASLTQKTQIIAWLVGGIALICLLILIN